jgi:hypothetical protein
MDALARQHASEQAAAVHLQLEAARVQYAAELQASLDASETTHRAALATALNKCVGGGVCGKRGWGMGQAGGGGPGFLRAAADH